MRISPLARATALMVQLAAGVGSAAAQPVPPGQAPTPVLAPGLIPSLSLQPLPKSEPARPLPIVLRARTLSNQLDLTTLAEGDVEFRHAGLVIRTDRLQYDHAADLVQALGNVRVSRGGVSYSGVELQLSVQRFEGFFLEPQFEFLQLGAGGRADRLDFLGNSRSRASNASYTSCPREGGTGGPVAEPAWVLQTDRVSFDLETNEGVAEGARLRFLGVTILALPTLSFPLDDARKSGWLPPSVSIDNRSGVELTMPYYWNLAANRDATLAPRVITRRGLGLDVEFRYLEPEHEGSFQLDWLPHDRATGQARQLVQWLAEGKLAGRLNYSVDLLRVSDNDWWKDFPGASRSFTSRLLPQRLALERPFEFGTWGAEGLLYARANLWQVLQASDSPITSPYQRAPQLGLRLDARRAGWEMALQTEFNRFTLPRGEPADSLRTEGDRWHLLGSLSRPHRGAGWWWTPRLSVNAAAYSSSRDGMSAAALLRHSAQQASRVIPSFSIDSGLELERNAVYFGRTLYQTLEPRLLYVNTPYRAQSGLPNYDAAARDFNFVSIYSDNSFSGVDRVSDGHQITAGLTTRLVDAVTGAEALRLGLVQRFLFRGQRVTAQADGTPDGEPVTRKFSDALLLGSTSVFPGWTLDAAVQYSPELQRSVRTIVGARYSPGPFRTVGATYRLARGLSEQLEVGWQWPIWQAARATNATAAGAGGAMARAVAAGGSGCSGSWYAVGRLNYSLKDRRVTDSVLGFEYDAGCWIARVVAEQLSTGRSAATTKLLLQLELVGLSRLGSNPLKVLKDNIPGYRLLRDERGSASSPSADRPTVSPFYD